MPCELAVLGNCCCTPQGMSLTDSMLLAILQLTFGSAGKATSKGKSGLASASRPPVPRLNSAVDTDADSVSVAESDDVSVMTEDDYGPQEGDSVQVRSLTGQSHTCLQCPAVFHWLVPLAYAWHILTPLDALQVFVRVRPINAAESAEGEGLCLTVLNVQAVSL
jgi:hypothetical protein